MEGAPEQHQHVHAEVVDVKEPWLGKEKDKDSEELGHRDTTEHRRPHVVQGGLGPLSPPTNVGHKPTYNVRAEFDRYSNRLCECVKMKRGEKRKEKQGESYYSWWWNLKYMYWTQIFIQS